MPNDILNELFPDRVHCHFLPMKIGNTTETANEGAQLILAKERLIPSIENPVQRQKKGEAA